MKTRITISILALIIILFFNGVVFSQTSLKQAEDQMRKYNYSTALNMYLNHFASNIPNETDIRNVTYCYIKLNDSENAEKWLSKLVLKNVANYEDLTIYAAILKSEAKYDEAINIYKKIAEKFPDKSSFAQKQIDDLVIIKSWLNEKPFYKIIPADGINTEYSDFGIIKFGDDVLFSSDRFIKGKNSEVYGWTGRSFIKIFKASINKDGSFSKINLIENLNNEYHNSPGYFDNNTNTLYFTRTKVVEKNQKKSNPDPTSWFNEETDDIFTNRLEIYYSTLKNGKWESPQAFEHNNAAQYSVGHPVLSKDGSIMYFVSDMPGSLGETDIFYSVKLENGKWSNPRNCGPIINTPGKEMFPSFDEEGNLYFSSNYHAGLGGLDIFKTTGEKNSWAEPENLKSPINSSKDDFGIYFISSGLDGYISSNRDGSSGNDDIYRFVYSPPLPENIILVVKTFERINDFEIRPLEEYIRVHYHDDSDMQKENIIPAKAPGVYLTTLDCNKKYFVHGVSNDFFAQSKEIFTECNKMNDTIFVDLIFDRIVLYKPIVIENIYYDFDKWNIRPDAAVELDKIVTLLLENPQIIIELGSHTDSRGSFQYNEVLSQRRAESAVQYVISKGISPERITAKGYGEYQLVNNCSDGVWCSEEDHQMNRRTEFKVIGFSKEQPVIYSAEGK